MIAWRRDFDVSDINIAVCCLEIFEFNILDCSFSEHDLQTVQSHFVLSSLFSQCSSSHIKSKEREFPLLFEPVEQTKYFYLSEWVIIKGADKVER